MIERYSETGYEGLTPELDVTVVRAAEMLEAAFDMDVAIRFDLSRRSGAAWLKTGDGWTSAHVGLGAALRVGCKCGHWVRHHDYGGLGKSTIICGPCQCCRCRAFKEGPDIMDIQAILDPEYAQGGKGVILRDFQTLEEGLVFLVVSVNLYEC